MRLLGKKKINLDVKAILAFALPVLIMALAFLFAQTEPGSILPVEATLRHSKTDEDIITTVNDGMKDHDVILDSLSSDSAMLRNNGIKRIITEYCDPFFILSLGMEGGMCLVFLFLAFFIRFGLAGLMMQRLLSSRIGFGAFFEVLLSVIYSLSSVALLSSSSVQLMDLMILLPLMLKGYDELIMPGGSMVNIKTVVICVLVFISGIHGMIQGIFASVVFGLFISITRYGRFAGVMRSLARIALNSLLAIVITAFINIPRFACIEYEKFEPGLFEEGGMNYALFDLFSANASGIAVDSSAYVVPAMYIGIITFILIMILYLNSSIPIRIKMIIMIVTVMVYATCAYDPVVRILSFTYFSNAGSVARLISLVVILFTAAGISARNLYAAGRNTIYASAFIAIAVVVISNASENVYGYMNYQLFVTPASAIGAVIFLLSYIRAHDRRIMIAFAVTATAVLFLNTAYSLMMSAVSPSDYVMSRYQDDSSGDEVESDVSLSVLDDRYAFVVVSDDDLVKTVNPDPAGMLNDLAAGMLIDEVFAGAEYEEVSNEGFVKDEDGSYYIDAGDVCELIISAEAEEDIYVSSGINGPVHISEMSSRIDRFPERMYHSGPFISRIPCGSGNVEVSLSMDDEGKYYGKTGVYYLRERELDKVMLMTGNIGNGRFTLQDENIPYKEGSRSLITGMPYNVNIRVTVQGSECATYNYQGLLAAHIGNAGTGAELEIVPELGGMVTGAMLTAVGLIMMGCLILITNKDTVRKNGGIIYA